MSGDAAPGKVLVVGDVMTDIICRPEGPLVVGSDRRAQIRSRPGGSGANQAAWLAAFGVPVRFVARVGADDRDRLVAEFRAIGIEAILASDPVLPSGALVTIVDPDGERSFLTDRGANIALSEDDLPEGLLEGCSALVVSGYSLFEPSPRAAVRSLMGKAVARGIAIMLDPSSAGFLEEVGRAEFLAWTDQADTIFANESEALALTGETGREAQVRALGAVYPRVVLKLGAAGAMLGTRDGVLVALPAPEVRVVDTTGAGDAFAAAFIAAEARGESSEAGLRRAIAAGSAAVQQVGGSPLVSHSP